ncbi:MAG: hypothetical protein R3A80_01470 [Bdellovibrionota bacterium]
MKNFLLLCLFSFCVSCASFKQKDEKRFLSVLTFNVENLFDAEHALGKLDYTYLPLSVKRSTLKQSVERYCAGVKNPQWRKECRELNWDEKRLKNKLFRISRVIEESTTGCPDVVILQEVENEKILKRLNSYLSCGYTSLMLSDDSDARGIDVAVLSRFEIRSSKTHVIPFKGISAEEKKDTRSLLEVELSIGGYALRVLALHLPAPFHPARYRKDAIDFVESLYFKDPIATVVAGDWNVTEKESSDKKPFSKLRKSFFISDDIVRASSSARGTSYYPKDKTWSFLDKIAMSRNSFDSVECRVVNEMPGQRDLKTGAPLSFPLFGKLSEGISDHFPVLCKASY